MANLLFLQGMLRKKEITKVTTQREIPRVGGASSASRSLAGLLMRTLAIVLLDTDHEMNLVSGSCGDVYEESACQGY